MGNRIELGQKVTDKLTGLVGIATARCEYLYDATSIRVERLDKDGDPQSCWLPEDRLEAAP